MQPTSPVLEPSPVRDSEIPVLVSNFDGASGEMLAAVLDQSMDCIKVIGASGSLDFMNRNGRCALEIDDFAAIAGLNWWDLWPDQAKPLVRDAVRRAQAGESSRFEAFCPTAKGNPRWWEVSASPLLDADGTMRGIISVSRDVTERVGAQALRQAVAEEMRHRLQNAYTLTGAIITASARGHADREAFASELLERLSRLGAAQALLLESDGVAVLPQLVRRLTEPFCAPGCALTFGAMPDIALDETDTRILALAIGELSTNSNKYGAFGSGGSVTIEARLDDGVLCVAWRERSVRLRSTEAEGSGNGHRLIERTLKSRRGSFDLRWRDDGLDVDIRLPGF
jgi:PAS domain S-box-containing protein